MIEPFSQKKGPPARTTPILKRTSASSSSIHPASTSNLPSAPEAERGIIASCIVDPDAIGSIQSAGISASDFDRVENRLIFAAIETLSSEDQAIDELSIADAMTPADLERIGGHPGLAGIEDAIGSTLFLQKWIEDVKSASARRKLIQAADRAKELASDPTGNLDEATAMLAEAASIETTGTSLIEELERRAFDVTKPPPDEPAIIEVAGTKQATGGNLFCISGPAGTAKTAVSGALMASSMGDDERDYLGFRLNNEAGKAVIRFDFEQSRGDFHRTDELVLRRAGIKTPPPWYGSYLLTGVDPARAFRLIRAAINQAAKRHGGITLLWLDGFADLVTSPNDESESFTAIRMLHELADDLQCVIGGVLHVNAGQSESLKMRGHIGSQVERKAAAVITLKKDSTGAISAFSSKARYAPLIESKGPRFEWNDELMMFTSIESRSEQRTTAKLAERIRLAHDMFLKEPGLSHGQAVERIIELEGVKTDAAKKRLAALRRDGVVYVQGATGLYHKGDVCHE